MCMVNINKLNRIFRCIFRKIKWNKIQKKIIFTHKQQNSFLQMEKGTEKGRKRRLFAVR